MYSTEDRTNTFFRDTTPLVLEDPRVMEEFVAWLGQVHPHHRAVVRASLRSPDWKNDRNRAAASRQEFKVSKERVLKTLPGLTPSKARYFAAAIRKFLDTSNEDTSNEEPWIEEQAVYDTAISSEPRHHFRLVRISERRARSVRVGRAENLKTRIHYVLVWDSFEKLKRNAPRQHICATGRRETRTQAADRLYREALGDTPQTGDDFRRLKEDAAFGGRLFAIVRAVGMSGLAIVGRGTADLYRRNLTIDDITQVCNLCQGYSTVFARRVEMKKDEGAKCLVSEALHCGYDPADLSSDKTELSSWLSQNHRELLQTTVQDPPRQHDLPPPEVAGRSLGMMMVPPPEAGALQGGNAYFLGGVDEASLGPHSTSYQVDPSEPDCIDWESYFPNVYPPLYL
ncbi:uncharacterized protein LTR77_010973 [Saxophila tyrrhenica]|uniref:Uncharacterized protein n=1 Tax=Saxophila tyrrhenica TaxID=1690608 RepID=A0AAV9NU35_9PEZI|nr:hypothetical protein LTR77_010973 [Saxophila tyrrhenica]